jgi:S-DNA-T family DNA segregation ATPase FtsK/SpoIIIE
VARHWHGARPVRLRALPTLVRLEELPGHPGVRLGVREGDHGLRLLPGAGHLVVFGDGGSGRTALLRTLVREVARARPADRLLVVDPRGTLAGERAAQRWLAHVTGDPHAAVRAWEPRLRERLIPPAADGDLWLVVDDLDLLPPTAWQPLLPLLPRAADLGLRVVVARRTGGAGRALYEPLLAILQELRTPGVLLSGSPTEGPLVGGVSARSAPPGRGCWVSPGDFEEPFQAAWVDP